MLLVSSLFVILIHTSVEPFYYYDKGSIYNIIIFVFKKLISFAVPSFIFLSGFKLFYGDKEYTSYKYFTFLKNRFYKIFVPYFVANFVYIIGYIYMFSAQYEVKQVLISIFLKGNIMGAFYFVVIIFQFYFLTPLFSYLNRYMDKPYILLLSFLINLLVKSRLVLNANTAFNSFYNTYNDRIFLSYIVYFVLGMYFAKNKDVVMRVIKNYKKFIGSYIVVLSIHTYLSYINFMAIWWYKYAEQGHIVFCSISIITLYIISYKCKDFFGDRGRKFINKYARVSYHIYLYHICAIYIIQAILSRIGLTKMYLIFPITTILCIIITYYVSVLIVEGKGKLKQLFIN